MKQIGAIAVIVLMVASVIGFTVFFSTPEPETPEVPPIQQSPTVIRYKADNLDAEIVQLLPSMRIAGTTTESNIDEIDRQVSGFSGVRTVRSLFRQPDAAGLGKGLLYVADISFSPETDRNALLSHIQGLSFLSEVNALSFALVSIPKKVVLVPEQADVNITKEHEFSDTIIEAFVRTDANTGEKIKLSLSAAFSGNVVSELVAFQSIDAFPSFEQKQAELNAQIVFLFPELFVQATVDSAELTDMNAFRQAFLSIKDVNGADVSLPQDFNAGESISKPAEIAIKLSLSTENSAIASQETGKILGAKSSSFTILQPGTISISEIIDPDTNSAFAVPEEKITVFLKTGHSIGQAVSLEIEYILSDKKIVSIRGKEK